MEIKIMAESEREKSGNKGKNTYTFDISKWYIVAIVIVAILAVIH